MNSIKHENVNIMLGSSTNMKIPEASNSITIIIYIPIPIQSCYFPFFSALLGGGGSIGGGGEGDIK